jgi:hypothetical protein
MLPSPGRFPKRNVDKRPSDTILSGLNVLTAKDLPLEQVNLSRWVERWY